MTSSSKVPMKFTTLPLEVQVMIFEFILDAQSMLSLLRTSRSLHSIAEPMLYREAVFLDDLSSRDVFSRLEGFKRRLRDKPCLGQHVSSLITPNLYLIGEIIPLLVNLRRLGIGDEFRPRPSYEEKEMTAIRTLSLTHFMLWYTNISIDNHDFIAFLKSQPSLQFIGIISTDTDLEDPFSQLDPTDLPCLHTLFTPMSSEVAKVLLPGRSIQHLDFAVQDEDEFPFEAAPFDTIRTLSCADAHFELQIRIVACCPNLRYLEISVWDIEWSLDEIFELLHLLDGIELQYLAVNVNIHEATDEDIASKFVPSTVATAFNHIPTLHVVDIHLDVAKEIYRYHRNTHTNQSGPSKMRALLESYSAWDVRWWRTYMLDWE